GAGRHPGTLGGRVARAPGYTFRYDVRQGEASMSSAPVQMGIVGLGRWAAVLARAARQSDKLKIVAGYSRTQDKRDAFAQEFGIPGVPDLETMLANPDIQGVILTVPNEQHLPIAEQAARAGKHVYTE